MLGSSAHARPQFFVVVARRNFVRARSSGMSAFPTRLRHGCHQAGLCLLAACCGLVWCVPSLPCLERLASQRSAHRRHQRPGAGPRAKTAHDRRKLRVGASVPGVAGRHSVVGWVEPPIDYQLAEAFEATRMDFPHDGGCHHNPKPLRR